MRKKSGVFIYALIMGLLVLSNSCKKEDIPVLTTSAVTEITQTTATSGGNITSDGGATITARGVCWSTEQTPTISNNKTTDGTGAGNFTSNISGLSANTTYYVRAYATNSKGTAYGSAISFTTKAQTEVTFYTSMGTFVAEMYDTLQPITVGNFVSLVNKKFYDGVIFHRVINNFMIQGGDPTGTGSGGPGYAISDEFNPLASNVQKSLSMANAGPNTGGSQFFVNLVDNLYLNPKHPVFGIVTSNFSVVQAIGSVETNSSNRPLTDVVMDSVRVTNK